MEQLPVRREVIISADSSAQLELRLQGFERALELRSGYIIAVRRDATPKGKLHAKIAYELTLPEGLPAVRRGRELPGRRNVHPARTHAHAPVRRAGVAPGGLAQTG
jgi:hypothetical protein